MFNNGLTILATLIVAVAVMSTVCGHPAAQSEDTGRAAAGPEEATTVKPGGIKGWLRDVHEKIRGPYRGGCNHTHHGESGRRGGPWNWVATKLGFRKSATTTEAATPTTAAAAEGGRPEIGDEKSEPEGDGRPGVGADETAPDAGDDRGPEFGGETPADAGDREEDNDRGPEIQDKSAGEDAFPQPPAPVTENSAENDSNGFSGEDLTSPSTASSEAVIDPRLRMEVARTEP